MNAVASVPTQLNASPDQTTLWHTLDVAEAAAFLAVNPATGLASPEALTRLAAVGANQLSI